MDLGASHICVVAALAVACGDRTGKVSSDGAGGTEHDGNGMQLDASAGAAGAGSTGGSGVIDANDYPDVDPAASAACKAEYDHQLQDLSCGNLCVGFSPLAPEGPEAAIVTAVFPEQLEVTLTSDGTAWKFAWIGEDLTQWFQVGEPVQMRRGPYVSWHWVDSGKHVAATYHFSDFVGGDPAPVPFAGPKLAVVPQCVYLNELDGCSVPAVVNTVLALDAATATESTLIANGESGAVGPWRITNVHSHRASGFTCGPDTADAGFVTTITLLGPVTDAGGQPALTDRAGAAAP